MKPACPFCADNISEISFYETDNFRTIYNIAPILPGHSLLVPKQHKESLMDFSDNQLSEMMLHTKKAIQLLQKAFSTEGFNLSLQEKYEAGQNIAHFHLHIIPRSPGDLKHPGDWYPKLIEANSKFIDSGMRPKLTWDEMKKIVDRIRQA